MKRRDFIKSSSFGAAGITIVPSHIFGKKVNKIAPSEKVNLACIGIGHRGGGITKSLHETGLANIVALCDVDMGAPHTIEVMKKFPNVPRFKDFREMFDKMGNQIDAVSVGTPDFSHFPITMLAMSLGKHVYVEKPMARTFQEVELMMAGAKKYKVATQMGNQGHSEANYFQFKAWKDAGVIKDVTAISAHMNSRRRWHEFDPKMTSYPKAEAIPSTLDWDTWLMTAQDHDYQKDFVNGQWRCWYDFGMGALGDWGAHLIDTAHQFLDLGLPHEIDPVYLEAHNPFFFPYSTTLSFKFPERGNMPPVEITWYDGMNNQPPLPEGFGTSVLDPNIPPPTDGSQFSEKLKPGKIIYSKDLTFKGGSHGSTLSMISSNNAKDMASKLPFVPESPSNHFANFLKACKGQEECRSSFDIAGPLSQVFTLGVMAQRLNTKLLFDRKTKQITNNPLANFLLQGAAPRKGWEEYYTLA
ncbi:Oxidoreductase family, NAD-binding Rossmann fold [Spirosomataceae bacterium TFI 002]|nr:Oxidoreductase family, NAD-binding Rossmann fold [Spirosomataceae bacterium TFI 002]